MTEQMTIFRKMLDDNNIIWQTGELGKVDAGGGGTVAMYIANLGVDTFDLGVPVLSMHAPFEIVSKTATLSSSEALSTNITSKSFSVCFLKAVIHSSIYCSPLKFGITTDTLYIIFSFTCKWQPPEHTPFLCL